MTIFERLERLELCSRVDDERILMCEPRTYTDEQTAELLHGLPEGDLEGIPHSYAQFQARHVGYKRYDLTGECKRDMAKEVLNVLGPRMPYPRATERQDLERNSCLLGF